MNDHDNPIIDCFIDIKNNLESIFYFTEYISKNTPIDLTDEIESLSDEIENIDNIIKSFGTQADIQEILNETLDSLEQFETRAIELEKTVEQYYPQVPVNKKRRRDGDDSERETGRKKLIFEI